MGDYGLRHGEPPTKEKKTKVQKMRQKEKAGRALRWAFGSLVVLVAAGGLVFREQLTGLLTPAPSEDIIRAPAIVRPQVNGNTMGDPKAPVEVVNFSNFQCLQCSRFATGEANDSAGGKVSEADIVQTYVATGRARLTYIPYSWSPETAFSPEEAAYCAGDQGRFWEYRDMVYLNAGNAKIGGINRGNLAAFAQVLGLDMGVFNKCFNGHQHLKEVARDVTYAKDSGLEATPSFLVNGRMVFRDMLVMEIDAALQQAANKITAPAPTAINTPAVVVPRRTDDGIILPPPTVRPRVNGNSLGDPRAPVKVVAFSNFECNHCARFALGGIGGESSEGTNEAAIVEQFVASGLVQYTYILYSRQPEEVFSAEAASYCAGEQGHFWEFRDLVFLNQSNRALSGDNHTDMAAFARALGLDMTRFLPCLENQRYGQQVQDDVRFGKSVGLKATPAFLVDGSLTFTPLLETAIVNALRQAGVDVPTLPAPNAPMTAP